MGISLGGCSEGSDDLPPLFGGGNNAAQIADLRQELADNGVSPLPAAPAVSDELFALGQALFFDRTLSGNTDVSCATCHVPGLGSADGRTLPGGVGGSGTGPTRAGGAVIPRNSPTVLNTHTLSAIFWDSRVERFPGGDLRTPAGPALTADMQAVLDPRWEFLAAQAMFPPTSRDEMRGALGENELADLDDDDFAGIWQGLIDRLLLVPEYVQLFDEAYPGTATMDLTFAHAANAMAAFEVRAFARTDSPLDAFLRGDDDALTEDQVAGGVEFFRGADCARCHSGTLFTDERNHNVGLPQFGPGKGNGPSGRDDFGRENVTGNPQHRYRFRTPSLWNVELTGPYGHVGQFARLEDIVAHFADVEQSLFLYDIVSEVDDPALVNTLVDNEQAVLDRLDDGLRSRRSFDVQKVTAFLRAMTADSARDLSDVTPTSVPSGLPLD